MGISEKNSAQYVTVQEDISSENVRSAFLSHSKVCDMEVSNREGQKIMRVFLPVTME